MPENPYLKIEDLPISTGKPERVNPYLSARENPYLEAAEVPILEQGVEPSLFQRGKEAITDFFRRDPGLGPLTEEDYAAFKPADVSISREPAIEPTISEEEIAIKQPFQIPEVGKIVKKAPTPGNYGDIIDRASVTHNVDPDLIRAVIDVESKGKPTAVSDKDAGGLMQLVPATAKELGVTDRFDPEQNIMGGAKYLRKMLDQFDDNETLALAAYNAGAGNVTKYGGIPPFKETQDYVEKVSGRYKKFKEEEDRRKAIEPIVPSVPSRDIEQLLPVEPVEPIDPALAMAGLTPEEAAIGRPISTITGKPIPTPEEEAAAGRAAMAVIPYGFASAVRGIVPPALERAIMDPITKAVVGKEYVSPIDEALKIGKYLPEEAQAAIGVPAHMAGAIVPLSVSFKTANAMMKAAGLPADLVLSTGPVMDRITGHIVRGGLAGAVYGGLEAGTPKGMAEDAAFFGALEGGLGAVGGIFRRIFSSNWYRNLEVPERGLVVQSAEDLLNAGHSEGTILRTLSDPVERGRLLEEALARRAAPERPIPTREDIIKDTIREEMVRAPEVPAVPERPIPTVPPVEIVPGVPPIIPKPIPELPPSLVKKFEPKIIPKVKPEKVKGKTLIAWIRAMGGIKDKTLPGEVRALTAKEAGVVGLTTKKIGKGLGFDEMASAAVAEGWLPENLEDESGAFMDLLGKDIFAIKEKKPEMRAKRLIDERKELEREERWKEFERAEIEELEHYATHPDEEARTDLDQWQREFIEETRRRTDEATAREIEESVKSEVESEDADMEGFKKDEGFTKFVESWDEKDLLDEEALAELEAWRAEKEVKEPVVVPEKIPPELKKMFLPELLSAHEKGGAFNLENKEPETTWGEPCRAKFEELTGEKWSPETVRKVKEEVVPEVEIPEKPIVEKPLAKIPEEKPLHEIALTEAIKDENINLFLSPELKQLHDHKARVLGFEKVGGSFVEGYLKKLAEVAEKTDMPAATAIYKALNAYKKGNITQASLDAEKILGKLHSAEMDVLTPDKVSELHKRNIQKVLKSGELTPEKYAELHEKDYGPLDEFMPEIVEKPKPEVVPEVEKEPEVERKPLPSQKLALEVERVFREEPEKDLDEFTAWILKHDYEVIDQASDLLMDRGMSSEIPDKERIKIISHARWLKRQALKIKEPLSETKARLLANIKAEKGSSELINDLSRLGADAMHRGHTTYKAFTAEMKTMLGDAWAKIKHLMQKAYFGAKKILRSERGAVEIKKPKRPWLTKSQKEQRAKKKAIKEKQLKIENAKEAKEQIHGMIRDRRQDLNLAAYETNLFVNDIEQQTTKAQREIIPFIIEKTDIPKSLNRPDLEKAYEKDKDNLAPIALQVKQHFDAGWLKMKEKIPDMSAEQIENYVTHIWDLDKGQKRIVTNWFITQNRFLKKRYIETLKEGIEELGLTPKVLDIGEIIRIHDGVANRAIENTKFVEGLKGLKYEGMPLVERADKAPQNWVYFDHPALRRGLVIPGELKMGEKVSPELSSLLEEMGVAIGRRISPVAFGKPVGKAGEYISGEPPEVRFQRFMSSRTVAHEIGHHLDEVLGLGYKFLNNYASELYAINRERIEGRIGEKGKYGEAYVRSAEEQIAEFFATLFTDASKAYRIAPNATADVLNRLRQDEVLSKLIDFDFEKQAKNLVEEQLNTLVKLPIKVHPDLEKPLKVIFESRIDHPVIRAYEVMNGVLKKTNLSLSLFHHFALGETGIPIMGPRKFLNIYFNPVKIYKAMVQGKFDIFEKEPVAKRWIGAGLQVGATADIPVNMIQNKLNNLARMTKNIPLINKTTEFIRTFNETWDKALWNYLHDTLKLYACESLGTKIDPIKDMTKQEQEIAQFVNDTFGGQNWDLLMVSPKSLQIMTWSLLSADWTTSTVRQALSPTGIGRVHKETIGLRRKLGAYFWVKAGLYFGVGINLLNYTFREWDEKEHPEYYEGMGERTFLDRTMAGNTMGHKTHLFVGRYEDGTERYIRWGKQFRELPELFFDDTGFSPISATLKKVGGKLAPMIQLTSKITTGTSPSGFRDDDIYGKKGWDRVYGIGKTLIKSPLPFATRALFQEGKEFHITDIAMPSSKGMTRWKSINLFKHAITKRDDQLLKETYQFTLMNNLPAYTLFSTALTILKAESTKEFNEGVKTTKDVKKKLEDITKRIGEIDSKKIDKLEDLIKLKNELEKDLTRLDNKYKRIQKENKDRKLGMDLLDQAIIDIKKYEIIEGE